MHAPLRAPTPRNRQGSDVVHHHPRDPGLLSPWRGREADLGAPGVLGLPVLPRSCCCLSGWWQQEVTLLPEQCWWQRLLLPSHSTKVSSRFSKCLLQKEVQSLLALLSKHHKLRFPGNKKNQNAQFSAGQAGVTILCPM